MCETLVNLMITNLQELWSMRAIGAMMLTLKVISP